MALKLTPDDSKVPNLSDASDLSDANLRMPEPFAGENIPLNADDPFDPARETLEEWTDRFVREMEQRESEQRQRCRWTPLRLFGLEVRD